MLSFDQSAMTPLHTDAQLQERAARLVGRAVHRQLWIMFLDENDYQLPLLVPCDELPDLPPEWPIPLGDFVDAAGAAAIFVVLERYASEQLTAADLAWAKHVANSCTVASVDLRGILLSHRKGVRWVAADDYAF
jgi:hypothetical protein